MNALSPWPRLPRLADAVLAIPVRNEAARIGDCLAALAAQTVPERFLPETSLAETSLAERFLPELPGLAAPQPVAPWRLTVLLLLNNCTDDTLQRVQALRPLLPFPLLPMRVTLPADKAHAGEARGRALDAAARLLEARGATDGLLLTTDADSRVAPDWLGGIHAAIEAGAEAVAGTVRYERAEMLALPPALRRRAVLEARYDALLARLEARCDPCGHDPWPRHRTASGASLAMTLQAYRRAGGLPRLRVGEDRAMLAALRATGARIRHAPEVRVRTACRLQGRAVGGAADTLRRQTLHPDLPCDPLLESAEAAQRRFTLRAALRRDWAPGAIMDLPGWEARLKLEAGYLYARRGLAFAALWPVLEAASPVLRPVPLTPRTLPAQIAAAGALLRRLGPPVGTGPGTGPVTPVGADDPAGSAPRVPAALPA